MLGPLADRLGFAAVATGTNADDAVAGFRPGIRAAAERGAATPLLDAGLSKAEIRDRVARVGAAHVGQAGRRMPVVAHRVRYRGHAQPAGAGRTRRGGASRLAGLAAASRYGTCGSGISAQWPGSSSTPVRCPGCAPLTVDLRPSSRWCKGLGFSDVHIDARGFRSGSMNELLAEPDVFR